MSFQLYVIQGNLTRNVDLKQVGQTQVAKFAIATSRKYKDKTGSLVEEVLFMDVAVWGAQANSCAQYLKKGSSALAQGYLKTEEWNDNSTGTPKSKVVLQADKVVFLGSKKSESEDTAPMPFGKADSQLKNATPEGQGLLELGGMGLPF